MTMTWFSFNENSFKFLEQCYVVLCLYPLYNPRSYKERINAKYFLANKTTKFPLTAIEWDHYSQMQILFIILFLFLPMILQIFL